MADQITGNGVEKIRSAVAQDLLSGRIDLLLGWEKGHYWWQSRPLFATTREDLDRLVWDSFCGVNLSRYLPDELNGQKKVGVLVKGCDARALNRLVQDRIVERKQVIAYGLPCPGILDYDRLVEAAGGRLEGITESNEQVTVQGANGSQTVPRNDLLQDRCRDCRYPDPVTYDQLLLEPLGKRQAAARFTAVTEREKASPDERYAYWTGELQRCLRCYACREVCPCCSCRECFVEQECPRWLGKSVELSEVFSFHLVRAYHCAGRCIECGECARACPMGINLMELNRKLIKDIDELYGEYEAGLDPEQEPPLLTYQPDDPAAFSEK